MGKAQAKALLSLKVKVLNKHGKTSGTFRMSAAGIDYYQKHAREATARYTWVQLVRLIINNL